MENRYQIEIDAAFVLLAIIAGLVLGWPVIVISIFAYFLGNVTCVLFFNKTSDYIQYKKVFVIGYLFFVLCAIYMVYHDFWWFLSPDTTRFVRRVELMVVGNEGNYFKILSSIFEDYNLFTSEECMFYAYSSLWGVLIWAFGGNFYMCLQLSVLFLYAFSGVLIYKILFLNGISDIKSKKYALIICTFSILLFYSSQVLRDIHIMLMYLSTFYIIFNTKRFSLKDLILLAIIIFITLGLRIESGLFLFTSIPLYLLSALQKSKQKTIVLILTIPITVALIYFSSKYYNSIMDVYAFNRDHYVDYVAEGSGVIGSLQKIPIVGPVLSIFYNALLPIPCWSKLSPSGGIYGLEAYNIMNFPKMTASFLNLMTIIFIFSWLFNKNNRKNLSKSVSKPMRYLLVCGFVFLYLQSAVIDFRRLMAYYCLYYVQFFVIWTNIDKEFRNKLTIRTIIVFYCIQLFGIFYTI